MWPDPQATAKSRPASSVATGTTFIAEKIRPTAATRQAQLRPSLARLRSVVEVGQIRSRGLVCTRRGRWSADIAGQRSHAPPRRDRGETPRPSGRVGESLAPCAWPAPEVGNLRHPMVTKTAQPLLSHLGLHYWGGSYCALRDRNRKPNPARSHSMESRLAGYEPCSRAIISRTRV